MRILQRQKRSEMRMGNWARDWIRQGSTGGSCNWQRKVTSWWIPDARYYKQIQQVTVIRTSHFVHNCKRCGGTFPRFNSSVWFGHLFEGGMPWISVDRF